MPQLRILGRHRICLGHFTKERFHFACRQEGDQYPAPRFTDICPNVGHLAWCEERIAWLESHPLLPNLDQKLAFQHVEPLVLVIMEVSGRAAFRVECVLKDEETAVVVRDNLESNRADTKSPMLTISVVASRDPKRGRSARRRRRRLHHIML